MGAFKNDVEIKMGVLDPPTSSATFSLLLDIIVERFVKTFLFSNDLIKILSHQMTQKF